jgi:hypothetical protein
VLDICIINKKKIMKKINEKNMIEVSGGSITTAGIAAASCAGIAIISGFASFGIGLAILGPTCVGMIGATIWD